MAYVRQLNRPSDNFTMIPNGLIDMGLSCEALGFLLFIAGHRLENLRVTQIEKMLDIGKYKRRRIMNELKDKGLCHLVRDQTVKGEWVTFYVFDWDKAADHGQRSRTRHRITEDIEVIDIYNKADPTPEKPSPADQETPKAENQPSGAKTPKAENQPSGLKTSLSHKEYPLGGVPQGTPPLGGVNTEENSDRISPEKHRQIMEEYFGNRLRGDYLDPKKRD